MRNLDLADWLGAVPGSWDAVEGVGPCSERPHTFFHPYPMQKNVVGRRRPPAKGLGEVGGFLGRLSDVSNVQS